MDVEWGVCMLMGIKQEKYKNSFVQLYYNKLINTLAHSQTATYIHPIHIQAHTHTHIEGHMHVEFVHPSEIAVGSFF